MEKPPNRKTKGDAAHEISKALLSLIPVASGPLSIMFETIFSSPLNKRKEKWLRELSEVVTELQERIKDLTPEKLSQNEIFITITLQASQIALRNHHEEKLKALRNVIANTVLQSSPTEDLKIIFLRFIDELSPLHLRMLEFLSKPESYLKQVVKNLPPSYRRTLLNIWEEFYQSYKTEVPLLLIVNDLYYRDLITQNSIDTFVEKITTKFGDDFLFFIKEPDYKKHNNSMLCCEYNYVA